VKFVYENKKIHVNDISWEGNREFIHAGWSYEMPQDEPDWLKAHSNTIETRKRSPHNHNMTLNTPASLHGKSVYVFAYYSDINRDMLPQNDFQMDKVFCGHYKIEIRKKISMLYEKSDLCHLIIDVRATEEPLKSGDLLYSALGMVYKVLADIQAGSKWTRLPGIDLPLSTPIEFRMRDDIPVYCYKIITTNR